MASPLPIFRAITLGPALARRAYTLVRISNPSIDLKTWLDYVRAYAKVRGGDNGLIALIDARAYIHGLFAWSLLFDLSHQKKLRITDVILADLPGSALQHAIFVAFRDLAKFKGAGVVALLAEKQIGALHRDAALASGFRLSGELLEAISSFSPEPATAGSSSAGTQFGQLHEPAK